MVILYKLLDRLIIFFFRLYFCPILHLGNLRSMALLVTTNNTAGNQVIFCELIAICDWLNRP